MNSDLRFDGRVIIVTGAGGELGGVYAAILASRGAVVICADLSPTVTAFAQSLIDAGGQALAVIGSVTSQLDVDKLIETTMSTYGRIDGLINSAGVAYERTLHETSMEDIRKTYELHYFAPVMLIKAVWPHMAKAGYGRILNITSSTLFGLHGWGNYSAAKGAVATLARSVALEGAPVGIHINAMAPAATTKAMLRNITDETIRAQLSSARPELCGPLAAFLMHETSPCNGRVFFSGSGHVADILFAQSQGATVKDITLEDVQALILGSAMHENVKVYGDTLSQNAAQIAQIAQDSA